VKLTLGGVVVDALIATDERARYLIRGEDLWKRIAPITKDDGGGVQKKK
jgi:hypothetical protein